MAPILALVIETFVQHLHDLDKVVSVYLRLAREEPAIQAKGNALIVGHLRDLVHLCAGGTPWIVGSSLANLGLHIRITLCVILRDTERAFTECLKRHGSVGER